MIHVSLVEKVGHPLAMLGTMIGNQHGVSFSREVGMSAGGEDDEEDGLALEGAQVREERSRIVANAIDLWQFDIACVTPLDSQGRSRDKRKIAPCSWCTSMFVFGHDCIAVQNSKIAARP